MKSTGIIRRLDELGRIVLPMELRNKYEMKEKEAMEIYTDGDTIMLKKYVPDCIFCGSSKRLIKYKDKNICRKCANAILEEKT